jgi:hypothetical protein
VDFKIRSALNINKAISVHDYYSWYDNATNTWGSSAALKVHGTPDVRIREFSSPLLIYGVQFDIMSSHISQKKER